MATKINKKAFTLIELLIVITIIGILSTLLFRTLADMISANGKIQQEKIMTQELITLQTSINNITEHYPIIDMNQYKWKNNTEYGPIWTNGITDTLYLTNKNNEQIALYASENSLIFLKDKQEIKITNPDKTILTGIQFKVLPTSYYSGSIYQSLEPDQINAEWIWIYGKLYYNNKSPKPGPQSSYTLQHFIHLQP